MGSDICSLNSAPLETLAWRTNGYRHGNPVVANRECLYPCVAASQPEPSSRKRACTRPATRSIFKSTVAQTDRCSNGPKQEGYIATT